MMLTVVKLVVCSRQLDVCINVLGLGLLLAHCADRDASSSPDMQNVLQSCAGS